MLVTHCSIRSLRRLRRHEKAQQATLRATLRSLLALRHRLQPVVHHDLLYAPLLRHLGFCPLAAAIVSFGGHQLRRLQTIQQRATATAGGGMPLATAGGGTPLATAGATLLRTVRVFLRRTEQPTHLRLDCLGLDLCLLLLLFPRLHRRFLRRRLLLRRFGFRPGLFGSFGHELGVASPSAHPPRKPRQQGQHRRVAQSRQRAVPVVRSEVCHHLRRELTLVELWVLREREFTEGQLRQNGVERARSAHERLRPVGVVRRQRGVEHAVEGVDVEGGGVGLAQDEEGGELGLLEQSLEQRGRAL
mmetsp:Transcript_30291/g.78706  ORF Transcript_30291/g.78706 Transcript_30291/m.78706 type:complete len:303 (-) Transcript_30291:90-998(-)